MVKYKNKINKRFIIFNKGESLGMMVLLVLIAILLAFSIFRPAIKLSKRDRMAFHNLDSLLAAQESQRITNESTEQKEGVAMQRSKRDPPEGKPPGKKATGRSKPEEATYPPPKKESNPSYKKTAEPPAKKASPIELIDINLADSTALLALPQIGTTMSSRIHRYRERLGGFVAMEQLFEIKGMDSARFEAIRPHIILERQEVRQIHVNSDEFKVLLRHPYLEYEQVKAIVNYRDRRGLIKQWSQLQGIIGDCNPLLEEYISY